MSEERKVRLDVVTPTGQVFHDDVRIVIAPGFMGDLGVLPLHAPLITALKPGEMRIKYRESDEQWLIYALDGGYLEVFQDHVTILADGCERAEDIDTEAAHRDKEEAQSRLAEVGAEDETARKEDEMALARAENKLTVAYQTKDNTRV